MMRVLQLNGGPHHGERIDYEPFRQEHAVYDGGIWWNGTKYDFSHEAPNGTRVYVWRSPLVERLYEQLSDACDQQERLLENARIELSRAIREAT